MVGKEPFKPATVCLSARSFRELAIECNHRKGKGKRKERGTNGKMWEGQWNKAATTSARHNFSFSDLPTVALIQSRVSGSPQQKINGCWFNVASSAEVNYFDVIKV